MGAWSPELTTPAGETSENDLSDHAVAQQTPPPAAPRPLTARVRMRAWMEPRIRFAWLTGLVLILIAAGLGTFAAVQWQHQRWLISHGTKVNAVVQQAGDQILAGRKQPPSELVILQFDWHGQPHKTQPQVLAGRTEYIAPKDVVAINVNPNDPDDWTSLQSAEPLANRLFGAEVALAVGVLTAVGALGLRWSVLNAWRSGAGVEAIVVDSHHTALAPLSRAVRCTPATDSDRRIFSVYVPPRLGHPQAGQTLWVIVAKNAALAAAWFD